MFCMCGKFYLVSLANGTEKDVGLDKTVLVIGIKAFKCFEMFSQIY